MYPKTTIALVLGCILFGGGCTNTRYITDQTSIERQHEMRKHRSGTNVGDVLINTTNIILSIALNTEFEIAQSERAFKRITIINESPDSLIVNMVTDIVWKETGYCDIMGIVLPPKARQKLLVPYPAAYNIYFRTPISEEEKLEIRTDDKRNHYMLNPGFPVVPEVNK
jgi:hypothetical protein